MGDDKPCVLVSNSLELNLAILRQSLCQNYTNLHRKLKDNSIKKLIVKLRKKECELTAEESNRGDRHDIASNERIPHKPPESRHRDLFSSVCS